MGRTRRQHHVEVLLTEARTQLAENRVREAAETLERALDALDVRGTESADAIELLTPAELRVARMAGSGMKNREIAERLAVTVKGVEFHLANTYRKLGISSRTGLARLFNLAAPMLALVGSGV